MVSFVKKGGLTTFTTRLANHGSSFVQTLPLTIPAALAAFSLVAVSHLLIGQFKVSLVVPFGLLAAAAAGYYAHRIAADRAATTRPVDVAVLLGIGVWLMFNLLFTSEHLFTNRDPATYNLAGAWLTNHQSIIIEKPAAAELLAVPGLETESLGFATNPNNSSELHAQGTHILPALQALAGKAFGIEGVLRLNVVFGATALLAFYGFSRLVVRPGWAALGTLIMALSLPMLFMSRDSYTEPLTMTFIFGGLSLLVYAQRTRQTWQWWVAGLVLGAAALTRIDAYLVFAGIELFAILALATARKPDRSTLATCLLWLVAGMALSGYVAWLDTSVLSNHYYQAHKPLIVSEFKLILALAVIGVVAVLCNWKFGLVRKLDTLTRRWRDKTLWIAIGAFFAVLASRPLWYIGYQDNGVGTSVRTFSEQTLNWIIWYIGPVLMAAGVAGFALVATRILRGKDIYLLPFMTALSATAFLYLLQPNITGDQVWATRRLLPIVIPGFVLLGMFAFERLHAEKRLRFRGRRYNLETVTAVLATISVLSPLFITYPFLVRRLYVPELSQIQSVCAAVPADSVVVWAGEARFFATQPTRTICSNDSLGLGITEDTATNKTTLAKLADQAHEHNLKVVVGFYDDDTKLLPVSGAKATFEASSINYHEIEHTYKRPPRNMITLERNIMLGQLEGGGAITSLHAK